MHSLHQSIKPDRIADLIDRTETTLDSARLCVGCGADIEAVESDAAKFICDCCGKSAVCDVELIAIMAH